MAADPPPLMVSTPTLAALLKVTARRVQQLHSDGVFPSAGHGQWDALICVPAAVEHRLQNEIARVTKTPAEDRVREARARAIELRTAREQRNLIQTDEAFSIIDEIIGVYRSNYDGLPARVTRDPVMRKRLEKEIFDTQTRVADALEKREREIGRELGDAV